MAARRDDLVTMLARENGKTLGNAAMEVDSTIPKLRYNAALVDRPLRVGREIDAGTVWTNTRAVVHDQMEEGGFKHSGLGRLNGQRAIEEFQEIKHFVLPGR